MQQRMRSRRERALTPTRCCNRRGCSRASGAARALQRAGKTVVVVEATGSVARRGTGSRADSRVWMRVRAMARSRTRHLVARFAAGEVLDLLKRAKVDVETRAWPATYWLGRERRHFDADGAPAEPQAAHDAFDAIEDDHAAGESLLQYFVRKGVKSRCLDVADAVYANDYGESASELGAAEVAHEQKHWTGGEDYFVLRNGTLADAAAELARGLDVRLGWPVARVYRDAAGASVRSRRDEMLRARCCVVAAPLGVLKQGAPAFSPALPPAHAEAIRRLPVANALKVAVALDRPVWPCGWWNAVCGDALFPEVWRSGERVVVGFATGARADAVAALGAPAAARGLLDQLDAMFGARRATAAVRRHGDGGRAGFGSRHRAGVAPGAWRTRRFRGCYIYGISTRTMAVAGLFPSPPARGAARARRPASSAGVHCTAGLDPCVQWRRWPTARARAAALALDRLAVAEPPPAPARAPPPSLAGPCCCIAALWADFALANWRTAIWSRRFLCCAVLYQRGFEHFRDASWSRLARVVIWGDHYICTQSASSVCCNADHLDRLSSVFAEPAFGLETVETALRCLAVTRGDARHSTPDDGHDAGRGPNNDDAAVAEDISSDEGHVVGQVGG